MQCGNVVGSTTPPSIEQRIKYITYTDCYIKLYTKHLRMNEIYMIQFYTYADTYIDRDKAWEGVGGWITVICTMAIGYSNYKTISITPVV